MIEIPISDFKARCLSLLEEVNRTGECLTILKRGRPIALISPVPQSDYPQRALFGTVETFGDIIDPALADEDWECLQ